MYLPRINVTFSDDNLLKDIDAVDGIMGMVGTVDTPALIGVPKVVYNLKDAVTQGFTLADEPAFYRQLREFYAELGGNKELWIMGVEDTMTMAHMVDKDADDGAKLLLAASKNKVRTLGVFRKPDGGYNPGNAFYDADVEAALTKTITFGQDQNSRYNYLRILVEGRIANENSLDILTPKEIETDYGGLVVGGSVNDGSASIGAALGRKAKYGAEIKIGKVQNGPLQISQVYIGTKKLEDYLGLDTLHGTGVITFMNHPTKAGNYFTIDRMANTGDYRYWAHGAVIDKAAIIAVGTYVEEIENEIDIVDGKIDPADLAHLEGNIKKQIQFGMGDQISKNGLIVYINPNQGSQVINTSTLNINLRVRPKGYLSFINIDLGLTAE